MEEDQGRNFDLECQVCWNETDHWYHIKSACGHKVCRSCEGMLRQRGKRVHRHYNAIVCPLCRNVEDIPFEEFEKNREQLWEHEVLLTPSFSSPPPLPLPGPLTERLVPLLETTHSMSQCLSCETRFQYNNLTSRKCPNHATIACCFLCTTCNECHLQMNLLLFH